MSAPAPTDEDLARRAAAGDRAAFGEVVRRYGPRLFGFLRPMTPRGRETADLLQDVWLKVWQALPRWKDRHFRGWLFRIARNTAIDAGRSPSLPQSDDAILLTVASPEAEAVDAERIARLRRCLDLLKAQKPDFHTAVVTQMNGSKYEDIAGQTGVPINTVKTRIVRGKDALRQCVGEDES